MHTNKIPEAEGSNVPACPALGMFKIFLTSFTA